jgi:hypothetical protein
MEKLMTAKIQTGTTHLYMPGYCWLIMAFALAISCKQKQ